MSYLKSTKASLLAAGLSIRGCQIGMQGPQPCAKPRHFFKSDATSNSNYLGHSVVQNCTCDSPYCPANLRKVVKVAKRFLNGDLTSFFSTGHQICGHPTSESHI